MRQRQAELSFTDSTWVNASAERMAARAVEKLGREQDLTYHDPLPKARGRSFKVTCLECSRTFATRSFIPTCPGCGGSDCEPA
jgi:hypothetical protein